MSRISEPEPLAITTLSVDELCAALARQRAVNTELRTVIATQAELHQAELAARDAPIAQLGRRWRSLPTGSRSWSAGRA
jgi:hypothetical protein